VEALVRLSIRFGFIVDAEKEVLSITQEGQEFVKHVISLREIQTSQDDARVEVFDESSLSVTLPHFCQPLPLNIKNEISFTFSTMKQVITDAEKIIYISTPILDIPLLQSCFENVTRKPNATIKILTSEEKLIKYKNSQDVNFYLNEIGKLIKSRFRNGKVFYLNEDMSISHAKIFCSESSLFVGSANLKKDSITENFELGIYTERKDLINLVIQILDFVLATERPKCIYDTDFGEKS
jgi:PLD-like domain